MSKLDTIPLDILTSVGVGGWPYGHLLALNGETTDDYERLSLSDEHGVTIAHILASQGYVFEDMEILTLSTIDGWTVADAGMFKSHSRGYR